VPYADLNTADSETSLALTKDGKTVFLAAQGLSSADICIGTRPDPNSPFARPALTPITSISDPVSHEHDPSPSADGLPPTPIPGIDKQAGEGVRQPFISKNGLVLLFGVGSENNANTFDIHYAPPPRAIHAAGRFPTSTAPSKSRAVLP
jgi:hypothetical protein